ncbi:hypothetical protein PQD71_gp151 [Kosakonia phage Kc263]|uniref:Uncharacterized protein n=1 Tax=Kosakonia phage Kc263 TaxID=2863194 RepID=A0AAE7WI28_9CAUD|nr:hypothetical protein PQD71_gp151 [Kosakonia phage Kc263]QYN80044.1 hypothetical protein [Kosakonia phage Kc263]
MNNEIKAQLVNAIVDCPALTNFENYGGKTPNLAERILNNFDMVETGIIQTVDTSEYGNVIDKVINLRQGGMLIDICKELFKFPIAEEIAKWATYILARIEALKGVSILDVQGVKSAGVKFANTKNVIDGAQHRWEKFKKAIANNEPWKANQAEMQFHAILRDFTAQQSDIIKRIWGDEYFKALLIEDDLGKRYNTIKLEFNKVRDAKIRSAQGTKKMHENMKNMHSTRPATSSPGTTHINTYTALELPPATTLAEALGLIKAVIEYNALNNDQKCQQIWEMIETSPIRLEIIKNLKTNYWDHLKGDIQVPMLHLIEHNLDYTLTANGIKMLRKKVSNWVLERIRKGDVDDRIKEIQAHQSVYGHATRDHVAQPWDKNHAGWYTNAEPEEKENEMTPQEDFMKSIFVDVLKERSPSWFADNAMSGERKEIVDKLVDQLYENFVKPTFAKLDYGNIQNPVAGVNPLANHYTGHSILTQPAIEVRQLQLPSGQTVEIRGPKNDPLVNQLTQMFAPKPKVEVSGYRHLITFTACGLEHYLVYNEMAGNLAIQISHQRLNSNAPVNAQTLFTETTNSLENALRIFDNYKETLATTGNVDQAVHAAVFMYATIHPNKQ